MLRALVGEGPRLLGHLAAAASFPPSRPHRRDDAASRALLRVARCRTIAATRLSASIRFGYLYQRLSRPMSRALAFGTWKYARPSTSSTKGYFLCVRPEISSRTTASFTDPFCAYRNISATIQEHDATTAAASISFGSTSPGSWRAPRLLAISYANSHARGMVRRIASSCVVAGICASCLLMYPALNCRAGGSVLPSWRSA